MQIIDKINKIANNSTEELSNKASRHLLSEIERQGFSKKDAMEIVIKTTNEVLEKNHQNFQFAVAITEDFEHQKIVLLERYKQVSKSAILQIFNALNVKKDDEIVSIMVELKCKSFLEEVEKFYKHHSR